MLLLPRALISLSGRLERQTILRSWRTSTSRVCLPSFKCVTSATSSTYLVCWVRLADLWQTYVGEILVAVNPFKKIEGIYAQSKMVEYDHVGDRGSRPPHIFAVSDSAFTSMCANPPGRLANQVWALSAVFTTRSQPLIWKGLCHQWRVWCWKNRIRQAVREAGHLP